MTWGTPDRLDRVLRPASIAVIEAGPEGDFFGPRIRKNLGIGGFGGAVFRVTPGTKRRGSRLAYTSLSDIGQDLDLAVISAPLPSVPHLIHACSQAGVAGAVILPPLGDATAEQTRAIETRILKQIKSPGMRIIGLNSVGILCPHAKFNASLLRPMPLTGKVAFISQSRSLCEAILDHARQERVGFSHFVCVGSMLDVDIGDLINYFGSDPAVRSILFYVERLTRVRKFISASRSVARTKPIIALKPYRDRHGAPMGASVTASDALRTEDAVYDAIFERAGIVRVNTIQELFDCSRFLAGKPVPKRRGLAIIANAGAPAAMAVSALGAYGIEPAPLRPETAQALDELLPASWNRTNPIHVFREASPERYCRVVQTCSRAKEISELLIIHVPSAYETGSAVAASLERILKDTPFPVVAVWMGGERAEQGRKILRRAGIPTYDTPERAASTIASLTAYLRNIEMSQEIPPKLPHSLSFDKNKARGILGEALRRDEKTLAGPPFKALLKAYGIPVEGKTASSARRESGIELRLGMKQYAEVGPVICFGIGGAWSKVLRDQSIGLPPLNRLLASRLMENTKAYRLLENLPDTNQSTLARLEEILIRVSQLTTDFPDIEAMELDVLSAGPQEVVVQGGAVRVRLVDLPSPLHLAISPYPNQYEWTTRTKGEIEIFIRPIRPEDAPLLLELFASMSSQSIWFRFMGPVKSLSPEMVHQMTQIDYDRDIALVALGRSEAPGKMLGCCHLVKHPRYRWAEIAPMVGDAWQGKGVGAKLFEYCLAVAGERGIESVRGVVSSQNRHMLALADRFHMTRTRVPDSNEVELRIDLRKRTV
jgi:acetyltransferase